MKKIVSVIVSFLVLIGLCSCGTSTTTTTKKNTEDDTTIKRPDTYKSEDIGLDAYNNLDRLAFIDLEAFNYGVSSAGLNNSNSDGFDGQNWLYIDSNGEHVIAEAKGRGIINKIWTTGSYNEQALVKIYIDDPNTPVYENAYYNFTRGTVSPFVYPITKFWNQNGGGRINYLPIEFSSYMKVSIQNPGSTSMFYYVDYELTDSTRDVTPFTGEEDLSSYIQMLNNKTIDFKNGTGVTKKSVSGNIKSNSSYEFFNLEGKMQIQSIKITLPGLKLPSTANNADSNNTTMNYRDILNNLKIKIYWEDETTPSVNASFSTFFGMGTMGYNNTIQSLFYGVNDNNVLYNYFPMPFMKNAKIVVENTYSSDIELSVEVRSKKVDYDFYNVGYFTTEEKNFYVNTADPLDVTLLDAKGSGKIVSIQYNGYGESRKDVRFEEGDVRIYIDNSKTPQIITCGCEDFFNGAGYFIDANSSNKRGLHSSEFSGYTNWFVDKEVWANEASMYRLFINDAITYRDGIRFTIEHGGGERNLNDPDWNTNVSVGYETLVCYYSSNIKRMSETDSINLSNDSERESHNYTSLSSTTKRTQSSFYSGFSLVKEEYVGFSDTNTISFTMNIDENNNGVILSRIFDNTDGNIGASVYIDGKYAGEWYKAGYNDVLSLTEDRIHINSKFTKGKNTITVEIKPNTNSKWNAFIYKAYSMVDTIDLEDTLSEDTYNFKSTGYLMANSNGLSLSNTIKSDALCDFRLTRYYDGSYFITSTKSGVLLYASNDNISSIEIESRNLSDQFRFFINKLENGKCTIQNAHTKKYLQADLSFSNNPYEFDISKVNTRKLLVY